MALAPSEDPARVAAYEVKPRRLNYVLALIGAVVFVAIGIWMLLDEGTDFAEKGAGGLAVAFFGWCAVIIVQRMGRGAPLRLTREGVEYAFPPHYDQRKLIRWRDIEGFGISRVQRQEFNFICLGRLDDLARQFSESEATQTVKVYRRVLSFAGAAEIVAGANLEFDGASEIAEVRRGSGAVASLADMLRFNRQKFGGEICLGWPDRDRNAARFHELLNGWKAHADAQR